MFVAGLGRRQRIFNGRQPKDELTAQRRVSFILAPPCSTKPGPLIPRQVRREAQLWRRGARDTAGNASLGGPTPLAQMGVPRLQEGDQTPQAGLQDGLRFLCVAREKRPLLRSRLKSCRGANSGSVALLYLGVQFAC